MHHGGHRYSNGAELLIDIFALRFEVCRRFLFAVLVEGVSGFDAVAMCRRPHGKNRRGLELIRIELVTIPIFPGTGCSGLNNPDSGVWAGGLLYIRLHRLERDAEADV